MTSTFTPFGFRPARKVGSNVNNAGISEYRVSNGWTGNIFYGDLVILDNTAGGGGIVQSSTSTDYVQGVFLGCNYIDSITGQPRWSRHFPAGTSSRDSQIRARVANDPNATFWVQAAASVTVGDIGLNIGFSAGSGSTLTGRSGAAASPGTGRSTTGVGPLRVIGLYETPDNSFTDAYPLIEVKLNQHALARVSAG